MSCFGYDIKIKWGGGGGEELQKRKSIYAFCVTCKFKMKYIFLITRPSTLLPFSIFLISIDIRYSCTEYFFLWYNIKKIVYSRNPFKPTSIQPACKKVSSNFKTGSTLKCRNAFGFDFTALTQLFIKPFKKGIESQTQIF